MAVVSKEDLFALKGKDIGTSEWMLIDQDRVNKFAEATGDFQFIHVDPERAKLTPFGGPIAHGFLSLSLLPVLTALGMYREEAYTEHGGHQPVVGEFTGVLAPAAK